MTHGHAWIREQDWPVKYGPDLCERGDGACCDVMAWQPLFCTEQLSNSATPKSAPRPTSVSLPPGWATTSYATLRASSPVWEQASTRTANHPRDIVGRSVMGAMMAPIPAARHGFGHYTGLRLTATDVLLRGDSLTLRAGSDLHLLLQGIGFADWVGDAGALVGWMSRAELRWARPTTLGEFSLACHVDRRGDEFRHGQVQAVWQARF
jgi:hypothetical protein